jgi:hypothetical protein
MNQSVHSRPSGLALSVGRNKGNHMNAVFPFQIALPILKVKEKIDNNFLPEGDILGTCFSIGKGFLITASHVVDTIINCDGMVGIVDREKRMWHASPIIDIEKLDCDISIIKVEYTPMIYEMSVLNILWSTTKLGIFTDVSTIGYPHGSVETNSGFDYLPRGIKGSIVSAPDNFQRIGTSEKGFGVYELSFQVPAQLSGGPLIFQQETSTIVGLVIGNRSTKTLLFQNEEIIKSENKTVVVQQYDSMSLGIAVRQDTIFPLNSRILGDKIGDYLYKNELVSK